MKSDAEIIKKTYLTTLSKKNVFFYERKPTQRVRSISVRQEMSLTDIESKTYSYGT